MRNIIIIAAIAAAVLLEFFAYRDPLSALGLESKQAVEAERFEDRTVRDRNGEEVGEIETVIIDPGTGIVNFVLVGGEGGEEHLAPYEALELRGDDFYLDMEEDTFEDSPEHDPGRFDEPGYLDEVRDYFMKMP